MLKVQEIRELIKAIDQSSIQEFKYEQDGTKLLLRKSEAKAVDKQIQAENTAIAVLPPRQEKIVVQEPIKLEMKEEASTSAKKEKLHSITSPMVGTFYAAPSPDSSPYVKIGDRVKKESVVCIVEAMKLMNELEAEIDGEIVEILVDNGQLVEYGQELFLVR